jgi:hypothetical protein
VFRVFLQLSSETFFILRRTEKDTIKKTCIGLYAEYPSFLNFLEGLSKNTRIFSFMKIRPVGDELFHADGQTDGHDKANSNFSLFCESTKKE